MKLKKKKEKWGWVRKPGEMGGEDRVGVKEGEEEVGSVKRRGQER